MFFEILQTPKASLEVKELKVDISKDGTSKQNLIVKLQILPIVVQRNEPRASCDLSSTFCTGETLSVGQSSSALVDRSSTLFVCEEFSLTCEFGHDRYYPLAKYVYSYRYKFHAFVIGVKICLSSVSFYLISLLCYLLLLFWILQFEQIYPTWNDASL